MMKTPKVIDSMKTVHTSISVPLDVLEEARKYGINISAAATNGIKASVEREKKIKELGL